jgi:large subunit ribosomal protein L29
MKAEELRELSDRDLVRRLEDNRKKLFDTRFDIATRRTKNHQLIPETKRDIARINTILRERDLMREYVGEDVAPQDDVAVTAPARATPRRGGLFRRGK